MLLAASGILNGRKATMHCFAQDEMSEYGQSFFITELRIKGILSLQEGSLQELIWDFGSRKDSQVLKLRLLLNTEWNMRGEVLFGSNLTSFYPALTAVRLPPQNSANGRAARKNNGYVLIISGDDKTPTD